MVERFRMRFSPWLHAGPRHKGKVYILLTSSQACGSDWAGFSQSLKTWIFPHSCLKKGKVMPHPKPRLYENRKRAGDPSHW
jgi:hypothetical protein